MTDYITASQIYILAFMLAASFSFLMVSTGVSYIIHELRTFYRYDSKDFIEEDDNVMG